MLRRRIPDCGRVQCGEKLLLCYLVGVLLGIILLQFVDKEYLYRYGFFSESTLERLRYMEINRRGLFFYCIRKRFFLAILLITFALTNLAPMVIAFFSAWVGFGTGAWITVASVRFGIAGPLLYIGIIMPQALAYFAAFLLYFRWSKEIHERQWSSFGKIVQLLLILIVFLVGILLESYVNPIILKNFIKFLL